MRTPPADIPVDAALVVRLLRAQHPDLATMHVRIVANGWDNVTARLGDDLAVRLPRRSVAAELVRHEQLALPGIAARVPVPVPAPVRIGVPSGEYPWHWSVVPWFDGVPAAHVEPGEGVARDLAAFVLALHTEAPDAPPPVGAPHNPVRGGALSDRTEAVLERLASGRVPRAAAVRTLWRACAAVPGRTGPPRPHRPSQVDPRRPAPVEPARPGRPPRGRHRLR